MRFKVGDSNLNMFLLFFWKSAFKFGKLLAAQCLILMLLSNAARFMLSWCLKDRVVLKKQTSLHRLITDGIIHFSVRIHGRINKHHYISTRGHAIQVHVYVTMPCVVIVWLTILSMSLEQRVLCSLIVVSQHQQ